MSSSEDETDPRYRRVKTILAIRRELKKYHNAMDAEYQHKINQIVSKEDRYSKKYNGKDFVTALYEEINKVGEGKSEKPLGTNAGLEATLLELVTQLRNNQRAEEYLKSQSKGEMPKGISDAKVGAKALVSPSVSVAQKKENQLKYEMMSDFNALVDGISKAKAGKYKEEIGKIKQGSYEQQAVRLYMGVARAVARRQLMVGPDYTAEYLERTQKGIQEILSAIAYGRPIPNPDLLTRVKGESFDKEKKIATVSDKHDNQVDIYVGVGKAPAGTVGAD